MMQIRQATLDDTQAISELFRQSVTRWQRMDETGQVEDVSYADLSIYDRWLHGGAWMSVETGAIWLSHLARGAGQAVVVTTDGQVSGYVELFNGHEPAPYGQHSHIGALVTKDDSATLSDELMAHIVQSAGKVSKLTVSTSAHDEQAIAFYQRHQFQTVTRLQSLTIPAQLGQGFYKAAAHPDASSDQIAGWSMALGRLTSGRAQWEALWPRLWDAVPRIVARKTLRVHFFAAGQEAFVCYQQQLYDPRSADVYCWTPKAFSPQLLVAIRDYAHREGFRTLKVAVNDNVAKLMSSESEKFPYQQTIFARDL